VSDEFAAFTTIVVSSAAPTKRITALAKHVQLTIAPQSRTQNQKTKIDPRWLVKRLGSEQVTSLLVEGGGEVNSSFLLSGLAHRVAFFYAPMVLGGRDSRKGVSGDGIKRVADMIKLSEVDFKWLGPDLLLTGRVSNAKS
jgi:diaminohydroxyphosphoribosylaminopyrimidine deaminase/5-amino-6-(5-phosphoribosylamino)uracil reductase